MRRTRKTKRGLALAAPVLALFLVALSCSNGMTASEQRGERKFPGQRLILTVAGNGSGSAGELPSDGQSATGFALTNPSSVAVDANENLYFGDASIHRVFKVDRSGAIVTFAGGGSWGLGDGGPATAADLGSPTGIVAGDGGVVYIADEGNNRIRKVDARGIITTVAGGGASGTVDGILALSATLQSPRGVALDGSGNLYILDNNNDENLVRRVDRKGIIATVAGGGSDPVESGIPATAVNLGTIDGMAVDSAGALYLTQAGKHQVLVIGADRLVSVIGFGSLVKPGALAVDRGGNLYAAVTDLEMETQTVMRRDPNGGITRVAGGGSSSPVDGGPAADADLGVDSPMGMAADQWGNLLLIDSLNYRIRKVY